MQFLPLLTSSFAQTATCAIHPGIDLILNAVIVWRAHQNAWFLSHGYLWLGLLGWLYWSQEMRTPIFSFSCEGVPKHLFLGWSRSLSLMSYDIPSSENLHRGEDV